MKKIVFIVPSLNSVGGAQKMARFVIDNALNVSGLFDVYIISQQKSKKELTFDTRVELIRLKNKLNEAMPRIKRVMIRFFAMCEIKKIIKELKPELVCVFGITSSSLLALKPFKCKKIYCERGDPYSYPKYLQRIIKKTICDFKAVVLQTDNVRSFFDFLDKDKIYVIPNPCLTTIPPVYGGNFNSNVLIAAGRLVAEKRFDFIIKAFKELISRHHDLTLRIFGDGEEKAKLLSLVDNMNLSERVFIYNGTPNLLKEIVQSKLFLFASTYEGVPNVIIESCSVGIPCVCTDCSPGGIDFLTHHGEIGGKMVAVDDFNGYVQACLDMIEKEEQYLQYSLSGISFRERFKKESIIKKWADLFNAAILIG